MFKRLFCLIMIGCLVFGAGLAGCTKKDGLTAGQKQSCHQRAEEALAIAQGIYITSRDVYKELRAAGQISDAEHARIIVADKRLKAAYLIAQDAVASHDEPTIKDALQTVCAMADIMLDEISSITNADEDTVRNVRIALIVIRRIAMII